MNTDLNTLIGFKTAFKVTLGILSAYMVYQFVLLVLEIGAWNNVYAIALNYLFG